MNPLPLVLGELRHNRAAVAAVAVLIALAVSLGIAVSAQERALRQTSRKTSLTRSSAREGSFIIRRMKRKILALCRV